MAGYQCRNTTCSRTFARDISRPKIVDDVVRYGTTSSYTPSEWLSASHAWHSLGLRRNETCPLRQTMHMICRHFAIEF